MSVGQSVSHGTKELYAFGPFRIDPDKETVLRAGEPVSLTPKTFQILLVLVRHSQEVVTKDDLMKTVWPDTFVEEANLSRNIFMLRRRSVTPRRIAILSPCPDEDTGSLKMCGWSRSRKSLSSLQATPRCGSMSRRRSPGYWWRRP